jgi:exodeoxyribonuclease V gamma subunit
MSGLKIFTSNRLEILSEQLAGIVRAPLPNTLNPEVIVVQSKGMERWISLELARQNGISANCNFPFPNVFLENIFRKIIPNLPEASLFGPDVLTFRIMNILPELLSKPNFQNLKTYLRDDATNLKRYQLSGKIADLFDQYLVFRPEMIFRWEAGDRQGLDENRWQADLWRELTHGNEKWHRARLRKILLTKIADMSACVEDFPSRISLFGISWLPTFHLQAFAAISRMIQLNLFILNPCREYWYDITSDWEKRKIEKYYAIKEIPAKYLHLEDGNRLLASMGALGRDFLSFLGEFESELYEQFEDLDGANMLGAIQADILHLRDREIPAGQDPVPAMSPHISIENHKESGASLKTAFPSPGEPEWDRSIQIHSCHSPLREMEILYDNLLAMFEADSDLLPRDIIVMMPDIESYAPYVHIVFDSPEDGALRIPYSIADQSVKNEGRLIAGFLSIFDLKTSRFGASQILNLVQLPGIKEKFGLTESDVQKVEQWIQDTNIRWGIDAANRHRLGLPGYNENTWEAGIKRFLLGYAMPGNDENLFEGILPYDNLEGSEVQGLGKFLSFLEIIFSYRKKLQKPKSLKKWRLTLVSILDELILPNEEREPEIQLLRGVLDDLAQKENISGFHEAIDLEVIQAHLQDLLAKKSFAYGFLKGGLTFCALLPMRSIPFKVICLVGMNSDAFPRDTRSLGFDLIAKFPRKGDRSRRNDDKYLFLESIISARKILYISYVGQSIQDNTRIPPSTLVSELLDIIESGFGISEDKAVIRHRLQPFNPEYFKQDSNLFSYSRENLRAARQLIDQKDHRPFISTALSIPPVEWKSITAKQLCTFFLNPAKYLLQRRLGVFIDKKLLIPEERENFNLDNLQKHSIGQDLLKHRLSGSINKNDLSIQMAKGVLPHGNVGRNVFEDLSNEADIFIRRLDNFTNVESVDDIDVDLEINGFHLSGKLTGMHRPGLIRIRYAKKKAKDLLSTWVLHLVLCALKHRQCAPKTILVCKDGTWEFQPLDNGTHILHDLLQIYWQGLGEPLLLFPEASYAYAHQRLTKNKSQQSALSAARWRWLGNEFQKGESEDPYFKRCFKHTNPLGSEFEKMAVEIFSHLLEHCREI